MTTTQQPQIQEPLPTITISISGPPQSGKSSMTVILGQLLKEMGHNVVVAAVKQEDADRMYEMVKRQTHTPTLKPMNIVIIDDLKLTVQDDLK